VALAHDYDMVRLGMARYIHPYRDGIVLAELDSKDQRIGNALKVIGQLLIGHPEVGDAIPTAGPQLRSRTASPSMG
jgi:ribosomal protein S2